MFKAFRVISVLEGLSYLVILSVTIGLISREFVFPLGMLHGVLFLLYIVISFILSDKQRWSIMIWLGLFLAAIIPFAFILVEFYLRKATNLEKTAKAEA